MNGETAFIEDTPTDMDIHVNTAPLGGTATGDTPEKPRVQVSLSGGESDVVGDMPSTEIPLGLYTIPAPTYRHPQGFTFQGWQGEAYKKTIRVIDSDELGGLVYNQSQIFYSETLSLDKLLSSGSKLYIHEKARAAYPMDVGKNSMIVTFTLEIEVF